MTGSIGPLKQLFIDGLPTYKYDGTKGSKNLKSGALARDLGTSPQEIFRWFKRKKMPYYRAKRFVELNDSRITWEQIETFISGAIPRNGN